MRRTLPGINAEIAAAVARVTAAYDRVPVDRRPDVSGERWHRLEAEVDRACGAGDLDQARTAIRVWELHANRVLAPLAEGKPVEAVA